MKKLSVLLFVIGATVMTACDYQKTNRIEQKDLRAGDEWVYGVSPDSAARQLKNKYKENPELQQKADEIRQILYGSDSTAS